MHMHASTPTGLCTPRVDATTVLTKPLDRSSRLTAHMDKERLFAENSVHSATNNLGKIWSKNE